MKVSVVLPARNEEKNIKVALIDIVKHLKKKKYSFEIIVVANGCTDETEKIVKEISSFYSQLKLVRSRAGYGYALRKGLEEAKGDYLVVYNVDFYDLHLIDLVDIDLYGKDLIIGSKRAHWSKDERSFLRKFISFSFNSYLKLFYGFKGSDTHGIKLLKREVIEKILPRCRTENGIFDTEIVLKTQRAGFKLADFPVEVAEKRPSRFPNRFFRTFKDIFNLFLAMRKDDFCHNKEFFYNTISDRWENFSVYQIETKKRIRVVFDDLLGSISLKGKKFLDVGCGLGYFSQMASKKGAKVIGLDIGEDLIQKCRQKICSAQFVVGSATDLPFKGRFFDIVLATEVIEHVDDPQKAVSELLRVLKPGGYLVMTTPNKVFKPLFILLNLIGFRPYQGNENWFAPWVLKRLIKKNGGKIEKEKYFNFIYPARFFDVFEKYSFLNYLMINYGYLVRV